MPLTNKLLTLAFSAVGLLWLGACTGAIVTPSSRTGNAAGVAGPSSGGGGGDGSAGGDPQIVNCDEKAGTRVLRLTQAQYGNTARSLLATTTDVSADFLSDSSLTGFSTDSSALRASDRDVRDYQRAAETLAAEVVSKPVLLSRLVTCDLKTGDACVTSFIQSVGQKAFRRPVTPETTAAFLALYKKAPTLFPAGGDAQKNGVELVISAMLQAPEFLYRLELGTDDNVASSQLDDWELGSRLSYMLSQSMPDDELFRAAQAKELSTVSGLTAQLERLIKSPVGTAQVMSFHEQWLRVDRYEKIRRDAAKFPLYSPLLNAALKEETQRFVKEVVFEQKAGISALLNADFAYVNSVTAPLYEVATPAAGVWQKSTLPNERRGLLGQLGFLTTNAYFDKTDPIHRGVFVHQKVLCTELPSPSAAATGTPEPPFDATVRTRREQVAAHTSDVASCAGCHRAINPPGFAFEQFNAIGQLQRSDRGQPIDASGVLSIDDKDVSFANGRELSKALASSQQVSTCYATQWFRFAMGRPEAPADKCSIAQLSKVSNGLSPSFDEVARGIVLSKPFLNRARSE
jgi:Protein of unknown function (DUF1592)/Protein of unknown function (DUF1588)/Protein of unknown function (DUF1595)/Protein of unknown function (DUF1585)/Protein of unknown function (DUF1587)